MNSFIPYSSNSVGPSGPSKSENLKISLVLSALLTSSSLYAGAPALETSITVNGPSTSYINGVLSDDTTINITTAGSLNVTNYPYTISVTSFSDSDLTINNNGEINVDFASSEGVSGIYLRTYDASDSQITINNTGEINVHNTSDSAFGVYVYNCESAFDLYISNDGIIDVSTDDEMAVGIYTGHNSEDSEIINNGEITVDSNDNLGGEDSIGIYTPNNYGTIENTGIITAKVNGEADSDAFSMFIDNDGEGIVRNSGTLNGNIYVSDGSFENRGTVSLPNNAQAFIENFVNKANGILEIALSTDGTLGEDSSPNMTYSQLGSSTATFENGSKIKVDVSGTNEHVELLIGEQMEDVVTATTIDIQGSLSVTDNSALLDFEYVYDDGGGEIGEDSIHLNIVEGSTIYDSTVAGGGGSPAKANARLLEDFADQFDGMDDFIEELNECETDACVAKAVDELEVKLVSAGVGAAKQTAQAIAKIVRQRQPGFGAGGANSGEDMFTENNFWFKPFGTWGKQKDKGDLSGYDVDTYGFGVGLDGINSNNQQFGLAFFYTNADVETNNVDQTADIDGYTLMGYGSLPVIDNKTKFLYQLGYSWQNTDTSRETLTGNATADYTSKVANIDLKLMRDYQVNDQWLLQPTIGVSYTHFKSPSYSESGAGVANLDVDSFSTSEFLLNLGTVANYKIDDDSRFITSLDLSYDMQDKDDSVSSTTQGGLQLADSQSIDNGRFGYAIGVGYERQLNNNSNINFTYEYSGEGSRYSTNAVSLKYVLTF